MLVRHESEYKKTMPSGPWGSVLSLKGTFWWWLTDW